MNNQNTGLLVAIILILLIAVFGYGYYLNSNRTAQINVKATATNTPAEATTAPTQIMTPNPSTTMTTKTTTVDLTAQNNSGQTGTATLLEENGKLVVTLNLSGGTFTNPQPAHIHMGACPKPGDVVYPLTNVVDGKSVTTLNTTMDQLKAKLPLAINVHKSATDINTYTACGDIKL